MEKVIAFVVYPDCTPLDLIGPLQVLVGLGQPYRVVTVGESLDVIPTDVPLGVRPSHTFAEMPGPHVLVVPGGVVGTFERMAEGPVLDYVRRAAETAEVVASVCSGSLILASAGLLKGRRATTHWACQPVLEALGARYVRKRWVEDGKYLTAAGVSAGIDMALHLAARLTNEANARMIQTGIEYDPEPPFGGIDWDQADAKLWWAYAGQYGEGLSRGDIAKVFARHPALAAKLAFSSLTAPFRRPAAEGS